MTVAETLRRAKALINTPEKWTKGAYARDEAGKEAPTWSADAVCFCGVGAIWRAVEPSDDAWHEDNGLKVTEAARVLGRAAPRPVFHEWNDAPERTHAEVMAAFDRAIEIAEGNQ